MDRLDFDILRTMGLRPFSIYPSRPGGLKPGDVAEHLGLSVGLVRQRVAKLESSGFLRQYRVFPNLGLFGLRSAAHHYRVPPSTKRGRLEKLLKVDGVEGVWDYVGEDVMVLVAFASEAERRRRLELLATLLDTDPEPFNTYWCMYPKVGREPTPLDWRILHALLADARRPAAALAKELHVTPKTVRERVRRLRADGIFDDHLHIDTTSAPGVVVFGLAFAFEPGRAKDVIPSVLETFKDRILASWKQPDDGATGVDIDVYAQSLSEMRLMEDKARELVGVDEVTTLVLRGSMYSHDFMEERLARKAGVAERHK